MRSSVFPCGLLAVAATAGAAAAAGTDVAEFTRLARQWNNAGLRGDAAMRASLWAGDLVVIVPGMSPMERTAVASFARWARMAFARYETAALRSRVVGATATGGLSAHAAAPAAARPGG